MKKIITTLIALTISFSLIGCSSSAVPDKVLEQAVAEEYMPMWKWYADQEITITNEYEQPKKGELFTVIEYEVTYRLNDEEAAKNRAKGYETWLGKPLDAIRKSDGKFFFIKRGEKWYSRHRNLK